MRSRPFPFWPHYDADEMEAVQEVLGSGRVNYWTGDQGRHFEQEYAAFVGTRYAVAVMNGTVALEAAVRALGVSHGDEVITTSRTFIASASCVILQGGVPVIADVDRVSQDMTAGTIRAVLTERTRGIIAVHLGGWPCDMDAILALAPGKGAMGGGGLRSGSWSDL